MLGGNMFKKTNLIFIYLFLLFAILPIISAVPPSTQISLGQSGLDIAGIDFSVIKELTGRTAVVNVFNTSNGVPMITGISCQFQVFSVADIGSLIFTNSTPKQIGNTFYFGIPNNIYNKTSEYTRIIQCNSSTQGGFYKSTFYATPSGVEITTGRAIIDIGLLVMMMLFLIGCVVLFMENDHLLAKVGFLGLGYLLLIAITFISWNMATDFLLSAPFIAEMFRILFWVLIAGAFPLLIGAFAWYFIMLFQIKEIQRLMDKGFSEDEARRRMK
jgi:hypothetical protein